MALNLNTALLKNISNIRVRTHCRERPCGKVSDRKREACVIIDEDAGRRARPGGPRCGVACDGPRRLRPVG